MPCTTIVHVSGAAVYAVLATIIGVFIAVVLFIPFVRANYRKQGRLPASRILAWFALLVSSCSIWTYTLLPGPNSESYSCRRPQTNFGQFVYDVRDRGVGSFSELLTNQALLQFVFNIFLFLPLGFLVRYLWRRGLATILLVGFFASLLVELTQLTGIWGLYPCAYRIFDVDDLSANTLGAVLGFVFALPFTRKPPKVSTPKLYASTARRFLGMTCDLIFWMLLSSGIAVGLRVIHFYVLRESFDTYNDTAELLLANWLPPVIVLFLVMIWGKTPGDYSVAIRFMDEDGRSNLWHRIRRYVGGIAGLMVLSALTASQWWAAPLAVIFVLVTVFSVKPSKHSRGLPGLISGTYPRTEESLNLGVNDSSSSNGPEQSYAWAESGVSTQREPTPEDHPSE